MNQALAEILAARRSLIDAALSEWLPQPGGDDPGRLREAMRYAVLSGGKRLRPVLALAVFETCGGNISPVSAGCLRAACAIELVHCYSLVHDDLPAMDNDALRRGKPTVHRAFGEAIAILVGDALLTLAFEWIAQAGAEATAALARGAGSSGMVLGQARDLCSDRAQLPLGTVEQMHAEKTGALFEAAAEIGALMADGDRPSARAWAEFGRTVGILFQFADDREDCERLELREPASERARALLRQAFEQLGRIGVQQEDVLHALAQEIGTQALAKG